jgi:protein TonB
LRKDVLLSAATAITVALSAWAAWLEVRPARAGPVAVEQLDAVEVTAFRITPPARPVPLPLPELSTATLLPPDGVGVEVGTGTPAQVLPKLPRVLRDETATIKGVRTRVRYMDPIRPPYPRQARVMGWEGTVMLQVEVKPDGTVGEVSVVKTSGHALLDEAALTAVKGRRFAPAMEGNFPVRSVVNLPVRFDLKDQPEEKQGS